MTKVNKEVSSKKIKGKKLNGFSLSNIIIEFMSTQTPNINTMYNLLNLDGIILLRKI